MPAHHTRLLPRYLLSRHCQQREAQEAALNLEVVEQQAKAADARVAELQDQKRLLVREVKNARKALSDAEAANRAVLERALAELGLEDAGAGGQKEPQQ